MPSTPFEVEFLVTANVAPSQVMPYVRGIVKAFKIIFWRLEVFHIVDVLFYFYGIKIITKSGWVTLCGFPRRSLLKLHSIPSTNKKDEFVRARGRDCASMVLIGETSVPLFPLS